MGSKFWFLPMSFIILSLSTTIMNHANISKGQAIISNDYSFLFIMAMLTIAVLLEFVYLFVEKMVLE